MLSVGASAVLALAGGVTLTPVPSWAACGCPSRRKFGLAYTTPSKDLLDRAFIIIRLIRGPSKILAMSPSRDLPIPAAPLEMDKEEGQGQADDQNDEAVCVHAEQAEINITVEHFSGKAVSVIIY